MVKFLINRPIAVLMATLAVLLLGIFSISKIPTSLMPDIPIPEITVQLSYPNNSARELETNVVRPLRNQLIQVSNLKEISSETRDGIGIIKLIFEYKTNTDLAFIEVNEKVDASLNFLPRDIERPRVIKASATDIPVVNLTVSLKENFSKERFLELSDFTRTVLKKRLEQVPEIAMADISGLSKPEISIIPNIKKLRSLGVGSDIIIDAVNKNNFELGNLIVQNGIYQYNFKFSNQLKTIDDVKSIYLNINEKLFQLKDLAEVVLKPEKDKGIVYLNNKRAIVMSVIKQADARVYDLKESIEKLKESFKNDYPDLDFSTNQDQTKLLQLSIDNLKSSLFIGSFLAVIIMFFFLKDIKSPLIIAISIPISLITSLLLMYLFDMSINIISLSGLILGVGMMIDNSIIVIDNITQKLENGESLQNACIKGTNEIISPLISSVLTTCSVFLPLLFLSGITGALFYDQALAVTIGLISSLIVSILIIPVLYLRLKNKKIGLKKKFNHSGTFKVENFYEKGYNYFFKRKKIIYIISITSVLLAMVLLLSMPYSNLPNVNKDETILLIDWNENINIQENQKRVQNLIKGENEIKTIYSEIGEQQFILQRENSRSFSEASVYIKASNVDEIKNIQKNIQKNIRIVYPNAKFSIKASENIFQYLFGSKEEELILKVSLKGSIEVPDANEVNSIKKLIVDYTTSEIPLKKTAFIEVIHEKILLYDVIYDDLVKELKSFFDENFIDNLKTSQNFIPIKINYQNESLDEIISSSYVRNKNKEYIAVRNLIRIYSSEEYKSILADKNGEYLAFNIKTEKNTEEKIKEISSIFQDKSNYDVMFDGSFFDLKELKKNLIIIILIAIVLLYLIMAAQFESLWQPLIILMEIPIDIGGSLLFLWLFGETINIMAAIGIVVMSGVIINDSILKIHTINILRKKEGKNIEEAIKLAGKLRLKSILMTSLTTILALLPFLFIKGLGAELQKPLALTVIGGMLIGTFISLYFIPLMYSLLSKK